MSASDGFIVGTTKIVDHGPGNTRWDLVIVGDGYQASELAQYHTDVENFLTRFRATPPFDELFSGINVHRVDVVSTDSGADDPADCPEPGVPPGTGATPRTYFDAKFCSVGPGGVRLARLLTIDSTLALSVASAQVPLRNQVLCLVNSSKYGGSGGDVATCSTNAQGAEIAIHEMGHSAFHLADEYGGNGTGTPVGEPIEPNVTRDTNRVTNKWRALITATTPMPSQCEPSCAASTCISPGTPPAAGAVGTYEGAIYSDCNTYRPLPRCYMRDYAPFCPVCADVIRQTLQPFLPLPTGVYTIQQQSNGRFVDAHEIAEKDFALVTRPAQNNDTQRWIVTPSDNDTYTIQQLSNGRFVDAHEIAEKDFALVTRTAQNNDTQRWIVTPSGNNTYTIQQRSNGRFVDAHEIEGKDFALVTRPEQNNNTQRWIISPKITALIRVPSVLDFGLLGSNQVPPGFTVTIGLRIEPPSGDKIAHVARQNPPPDSLAQPGSTITIDYFWPGEPPDFLQTGKVYTTTLP
jgi:hypothetical protein